MAERGKEERTEQVSLDGYFSNQKYKNEFLFSKFTYFLDIQT